MFVLFAIRCLFEKFVFLFEPQVEQNNKTITANFNYLRCFSIIQ